MRFLFLLLLLPLTLIAAEVDTSDARIAQAFTGSVIGEDAMALIAALRHQGQAGLDRVRAVADRHPTVNNDFLINAVAGQIYARDSGLFWYTDLAEAQAAARRLRRPILSLRLLGRLDEVLSCANSRFFRILLYPDPTVSAWLRDHVVLHWSSERPAPVITVDFGDGRRLRTTITGNSLHYVLDAEGRPIDAIPGLMAPAAFLQQVQAAVAAHDALAALGAERDAALRAWHAARRGAVAHEALVPAGKPMAVRAEELSMMKCMAEMPVLRAMDIADVADVAEIPAPDANVDQVVLDTGLRERLLTYRLAEPENVDATLNTLRALLTEDTRRNTEELHPRIHAWFAEGAGMEFAPLNERIYRELFLTPANDPWHGLEPLEFNGVPGRGIGFGC